MRQEDDICTVCRLENGKAYLEWNFAPEGMQGAEPEEACRRNGDAVLLRLSDMQGNLVLECVQDTREEEPLASVLIQPHLWNGTEDPYLYSLEAASLAACASHKPDGGGVSGFRIRRRQWGEQGTHWKFAAKRLPLRMIRTDSQKEGRILLNGRSLMLKAVRYALPSARSAADCQQKILKDLQLLLGMGANCICIDAPSRLLLELCDRMGFLVCLPKESISEYDCGTEIRPREVMAGRGSAQAVLQGKDFAQEEHRREDSIGETDFAREADVLTKQEGKPEGEAFWVYGSRPEVFITLPPGIPLLRRGAEGLLLEESWLPSSRYYQYKARWSREPFVYLAPESLKRQKDGGYEVRCYSSCEKVALYSDGLLFEVKRGGCNPEGGEYCFQGVPARGPCIMLTAEGEGCSQSLAVHKTFV